ncbi:MAG TPA: hypothetical protein PK819_08755, partial [Thermomicrobiales bacterium]|nr:hypothetical protein [Thermomicrobiales bacterium]
MYGVDFDPASTDPASVIGAVFTSVGRVDGKRRFRKGHRITVEDLPDLVRVEHHLHLAQFDPDDVHEDDAALALAQAIAGPGIEVRRPIQSRVNLMAARRGLLRIDAATVIALNKVPGVSVFTLLDGIAVVPGKNVAGAKIAPVAISRSVLDDALALASQGTIVTVKPFLPKRVAVISTEGLEDAVRERFRSAVEKKISWYGSSVTGFTDLPDDVPMVAKAL